VTHTSLPCTGIYDAKLSAEPEVVNGDDVPLVLPPSQLLPGCAGSRVPYIQHAHYSRHAVSCLHVLCKLGQ
jgi:hypothetical protein